MCLPSSALSPASLIALRLPPLDAKHRAESELGPNTRPRSNTLPKSFGSTLEQAAQDAAAEVKGPRPTREETLELIQRRVKGKRQEDGWPDDIKVNTRPGCQRNAGIKIIKVHILYKFLDLYFFFLDSRGAVSHG